MDRINVTKSFMPPKENFLFYIDQIWDNGYLTNQGPLLQEFEKKAKEYLKVENFHFVTNGTLALQVAIEALDINDAEIITTPFSYVATTSAILWQGCTPVYVDIDPNTLCIDPSKIEAAITKNTKAILAVHVFGNPCDIDAIQSIAEKHNIKVIYDGAHTFGAKYKGKSLLDYGDITTCSFHATKLFHTIEGGAIIARDKQVSDNSELIKRFGHNGDNHVRLGLNAKASEFQAAMGICNLQYIDGLIQKRKAISDLYDSLLGDRFKKPVTPEKGTYNYGYYPIIIGSEEETLRFIGELAKDNIHPRRYFYPSLNTLSYIKDAKSCPISEDISSRILCLPLYADLDEEIVRKICEVITK